MEQIDSELQNAKKDMVAKDDEDKLLMAMDASLENDFRDPPLVAATLVDDGVSPLFEAVAVAAPGEEMNRGNRLNHLDIDTPEGSIALVEDALSADSIASNDQIYDEEAEISKKEKETNAARKCPHFKIILLVLLFLAVGSGVGVAIGLAGPKRESNKKEEANQEVMADDEPAVMVASVSTNSPSAASTAPSGAPSTSSNIFSVDSPRLCLDTFDLAFTKIIDITAAGSPLPTGRRQGGNVVSESSSQYVISNDGLSIVIDETGEALLTFDLTDLFDGPGKLQKWNRIYDIAVSGNGLWLVVGAGPENDATIAGTVLPFANGGSLYLYQLNETNSWEIVSEVQTGGGDSAGVFDVHASADGSNFAFLTGRRVDDSSFYVSVYSTAGDVFLPLGNNLFEEWINLNTTTGIVDERLFVCGSDGFIRSYDLADGAWQQVGDSIPHVESEMFLASENKSVLFMASLFSDLEAVDFHNSNWRPLDLTALNGRISVNDLVSISVSADGSEILLTEVIATSVTAFFIESTYRAQVFERVGNEYALAAMVEFVDEDDMKATQITDQGDVVFVLDSEILFYERVNCEV